MKTVLAIDTASPFCSVAVARGENFADAVVIETATSEGRGDHFEQLPSLVSEVLAKAGMVVGDLHLIGIGLGPGSFTGIRIGMSFAKGLAWAQSIPLRGFCSLRAAALSVSQHEVPSKKGGVGGCAVVADAGRDELFFLQVDASGAGAGSMQCEPRIVPRVELPAHITGVTVVITPQTALVDSVPMKEVVPSEVPIVLAKRVALGGAQLMLGGDPNGVPVKTVIVWEGEGDGA
jgi:tRNA threonylcarbamoyl adenosine modification protein YeaZ